MTSDIHRVSVTPTTQKPNRISMTSPKLKDTSMTSQLIDRRCQSETPTLRKGRKSMISPISNDSFINSHPHYQHNKGGRHSITPTFNRGGRFTPSQQPIKELHSSEHSTHAQTPTILLPPSLGLIRESTNLSQLSNYSNTSSLQGPLTRERNALKNTLRTRTRGGSRYMIKFNHFHCRVFKGDGGSISMVKRSRSNLETIVSIIKYLMNLYIFLSIIYLLV